MQNLVFHNPTRFHFGKVRIKAIAREIPKDANVLIIYGGGSIGQLFNQAVSPVFLALFSPEYKKRHLCFFPEHSKIFRNKKRSILYYGHIMIDYMKRHESYVKEMLEKKLDAEKLKELLAYHDKQIQWMQHERLVHLIVMLFVCLFTLLSFGFTVIRTSTPSLILSALLLILSVAYIIHYYQLENSVQKWYLISNQINQRL